MPNLEILANKWVIAPAQEDIVLNTARTYLDRDIVIRGASGGEIPAGPLRDQTDVIVNGAQITIPDGQYSSTVYKTVNLGVEGEPVASKTIANHIATVTPSVTNSEGYITGGTHIGTGITIGVNELVSGNISFTPSETRQANIDISTYATATVEAIPSTYVGSGITRQPAKTITPTTSEQTAVASGKYTTGIVKVAAIQTETKTAAANGTVYPDSGKYLSEVTVAIPYYDGSVAG